MKKLALFTLLYIAAPTLLFLIFWLKPLYSIVSAGCLIVAFFITINNLKNDPDNLENSKLYTVLGSSFALALVICLISEFGIVGYQSYDYQLHNFKLNLLATEHLPLYNVDRDVYMCYYLGFYIIPALIGKYLSVSLIAPFFFIFCWIGLGLSFAWVQLRVIRLPHIKRILICVSMLIGAYVSVVLPTFKWLFPNLPVEDGNTISINGKFVLNQIPAFTRGLSESPQHTLPAILGTCFLLAVWKKPAFFTHCAFFFCRPCSLLPLRLLA